MWCNAAALYCADACGGYIDGTNGTITSPFYPSIYPPNKNCVWLIVAPPQHRITVSFAHFDVEGNNVSVKPGFHYPSWRPELTRDRFPLPVNTVRVDA